MTIDEYLQGLERITGIRTPIQEDVIKAYWTASKEDRAWLDENCGRWLQERKRATKPKRMPVKQRILLWICRWAYKRAKKPDCTPVGLPGHRDPEHICEQYMPLTKKQMSIHTGGLCETDGHYLCKECKHRVHDGY